jgi:hypothetical protein
MIRGAVRYGFFSAVLVVGGIILLFSCNEEALWVNTGTSIVYPPTVHEVKVNSAGYGMLRLDKLAENDVYLVKVNNNRVAYSANIAPADYADGSGQADEGSRIPAGTFTTDTGETYIRYERHWRVVPPTEESPLMVSRSQTRSTMVEPTVGATKRSFFADVSPVTDNFEPVTATLRYNGDHCRIWVADDNYVDTDASSNSKVGRADIKKLADKFDEIYPLETNLLGYEYGGGPGGNGGADGDPKIQILILDIDGDYKNYYNGFTMGYFYPGDEYKRGGTYPASNEAEIFYLDVERITSDSPGEMETVYSTLIHEFNHMINFHLKVIQGGHMTSWNNELWYTEMLSMLAEDAIGPLVNIPPNGTSVSSLVSGHVIRQRIPTWLQTYNDTGVMQWPSNSSAASKYYYSSNYAFGAYLVRNFGGVALFSSVAKSYASGRASLDGCLRAINGREIDTAYAMARFGEALVYSGNTAPNTVFRFDKTVTGDINGIPYTFYGFDVWNMDEFLPPLVRDFKRLGDYSIPSNAVQLYQDATWSGKSGQLDILLKNVDTNTSYYVLVK